MGEHQKRKIPIHPCVCVNVANIGGFVLFRNEDFYCPRQNKKKKKREEKKQKKNDSKLFSRFHIAFKLCFDVPPLWGCFSSFFERNFFSC